MRKAIIFMQGTAAGILTEEEPRGPYRFEYVDGYDSLPVSLTMPVAVREYVFAAFPPFFEGFLPEGPQLDALLAARSLARNDLFGQLLAVGSDMVGAVTAKEAP